MTKADYAEMRFSEALTEADDFDLLVMGRTQGKGCYCFVNGLLSSQVTKYAKNYRYIVVDNEAGLEHLSRGILPKVDVILLVSDCSRRAFRPPAAWRRWSGSWIWAPRKWASSSTGPREAGSTTACGRRSTATA